MDCLHPKICCVPHLFAEDVPDGGDEDPVEWDAHHGVEHADNPAVVGGRSLVAVACQGNTAELSNIRGP